MQNYPYQNFYEVIEANAKNDPKKTAIFIDDKKATTKWRKDIRRRRNLAISKTETGLYDYWQL